MFRFALFAALVLVVSGCASVEPVRAVSTDHRQVSDVAERQVLQVNYAIGVEKSSFVGEQMLRVRGVRQSTRSFSSDGLQLSPTSNFSLKLPPFSNLEVTTADRIAVVGETERDGRTYRLVRLPGPSAALLRFLIDEEGQFEGSAINHTRARMGFTYLPSPSDVRLVDAAPQSFDGPVEVFANFELVYSGTDAESIRILYREYTDEDLARPAFSQDLVYGKSERLIRFRRVRIQVLQATNEQITFNVLEDGFPTDESVTRRTTE